MLTAAAAASAGWTEAVAKPEETPGPAPFGSGIPEQAERLWRGPAAIRAHDSRACALRFRRVWDFCDQAKRLR
jgi:hypothetical protein